MKYIGIATVFVVVLVALALLVALPTMWLCNYLFSSTFLYMVFGITQLSFWKAFWLNFLLGFLTFSPSKNT